MDNNMKRCSRCGCVKPIAEFYKNSRYCKICHNEYQSMWRKHKYTTDAEFRKKRYEQIKRFREKSKSIRGDTYGTERYAEARRIYQRAYLQMHKHEDKFKEKLNRIQGWSKLQEIKESVKQLEDLIFYGWYGRQD